MTDNEYAQECSRAKNAYDIKMAAHNSLPFLSKPAKGPRKHDTKRNISCFCYLLNSHNQPSGGHCPACQADKAAGRAVDSSTCPICLCKFLSSYSLGEIPKLVMQKALREEALRKIQFSSQPASINSSSGLFASPLPARITARDGIHESEMDKATIEYFKDMGPFFAVPGAFPEGFDHMGAIQTLALSTRMSSPSVLQRRQQQLELGLPTSKIGVVEIRSVDHVKISQNARKNHLDRQTGPSPASMRFDNEMRPS
ncbi:hypothetical protein B484DRAFT_467147 [Ochromonadaceae sp. CCMP2298]|nr:hypothetical protein B484DRAFT_467147 [Ochromonadaceae sp. CCMP2298]